VPDTQGKVVVVTGAGAGIGRAIARRFAEDGCKVALLSRGADGLEGARRDVEAAGGTALAIPTDVSDPEEVEAAAERVERELGPIDVWVNDAMVSVFSPVKEMTADEFKRVTDVTYLGYVYGTLSALRRMLPRDRGSILQVGSALAYRGIPLQAAYCGAKHAIQGFCDSLRSELIHDRSHVRLTMVQLPGVNTPQFDWIRAHTKGTPRPVGLVYQPEVAAAAIWKAAHSSRKEWIVGAPAYKAIFADKLASPLLDRQLADGFIEAQQDPQPLSRDRKDNLFEAVDENEDRGAHGRFDEGSRNRSPLLWASEHRGLVATGAALAIGASLLAARIGGGEKK